MRHWPRTGAEAPPHLAVQECECGSLFIIFSSQRGGGGGWGVEEGAESNKLFQRSSGFLSSTHTSYAEGSEEKMRSCFPSLGKKKKKEKRNE